MKNIRELVYNKIGKSINEEGTIVVLKGININELNLNINIKLEDIKEKLMYCMEIISSGRKIITYDEYLLLYEIITMHYKKIIIINNNVYMNLYPLSVQISQEKIDRLISHYDNEKDSDNVEIEGIMELSSIYANMLEVNGNYYVSYNNIIKNDKEEFINLFNIEEKLMSSITFKSTTHIYDINDEEDYLVLLDDIIHKGISEINIIEKNSVINRIILQEKVEILRYFFEGSVNIKSGVVEEKEESKCVNKEYLEILNKYWGYSSFRNMSVYDINKLSKKEKVVKEISQSNVISNIIEETEKCINKKDYRDIFVTAPTGAGKSVMFQIPAIYLAEKYELFTIVISPLIGLMKDQVANLELRNYKYSRTMNSDISPIEKQEIINDIADKKCHILYLSPESLLSRSDLDQIIGDRTLGLLVIDEAHIVTTWGKQFRPDYWYLGDHLNKIKKAQMKNENKGTSFVIATFTATAIYGGIENMYEETIESLKMVDPITYLGYIKRSDIKINITKSDVITNKSEYELDKFEQLIKKIEEALILDKKMLIYFPMVTLIDRFYAYCSTIESGGYNLTKYITKYHGKLRAYEKDENYKKFLNKETPIMLATKAFGMGIDIDDIEIVAHFAPTGNVCDYVQEIGRAARRPDLQGEAYYNFKSNDFKHINRLHGLSVVKEYQLIEVIKKIYELYQENIRKHRLEGNKLTKKRNGMLIDAESFSYIFENPYFSEDDGINKVKTALLIIQKDFERRFSFSPFHVKPIPLFEIGFFQMQPFVQAAIIKRYGPIINELDKLKHICSVNLKSIWEKEFMNKYSFPQFKYMIYSKDEEFSFEYKYEFRSALCVDIEFSENYLQKFESYFSAIKAIVNRSIREEKFYSIEGDGGLVDELKKELKINIYKARSIVDTILSAMSVYQRDYNKNIHSKMFVSKQLNNGEIKYKFLTGTSSFFRWIESAFYSIRENIQNGTMYLIDNGSKNGFKETLLILGILETLNLLVFKSIGGKNSQIYVYVNQTKSLREIVNSPWRYKNKLLELVAERHEVSVQMLSYIFKGEFSSEKIWDLLEDYFLGIIPISVINKYEKKTGKTIKISN